MVMKYLKKTMSLERRKKMNKCKLVDRLIKAITRYESEYNLLDDYQKPEYYKRIRTLRSNLLGLVGTNHPFFSRCKK
jgi:hypothetical protein